MRQFRKTTIKEVAARAGVSTTTVSLFVSGRESVCSPATAERIRQAVELLNYTPSSLTRALRQRSTTTLGVCLPNPLGLDILYGVAFFEGLWRGIMHQSDIEGYTLLHYPVVVRSGSNAGAFLDGRADGLILHNHANGRAIQLAEAGMPLVMVSRSTRLVDGVGAVATDERQTVDLALSHLWALGHRRIAHLAGPVGEHTVPAPSEPELPDDVAMQRLFAYSAWLTDRAAFDPSLIGYTGAWAAPEAAELLEGWLRRADPPTAVFCANDAQALDLLAAARARGLRLPQDLSVVGVDNAMDGRDSDPPLTTIEVRVEEIGREAVRTLLRLIRGATPEQCRVVLPISQLVRRASTAPPVK